MLVLCSSQNPCVTGESCSLLLDAALNAMITNMGRGNAELTNLPRKINIGLSTSRDDFAHCHINDVGLKVRWERQDRAALGVEARQAAG